MKQNDQILVDRLIKGNSAAFAQLFDLYFEKLVRVSEYYVCDIEVAKDVVMDVITSFIEKPERFKGVDNIYSYLNKIVRNKSLNKIRDLRIIDSHRDRVMESALVANLPDTYEDLFSVRLKKIYEAVDELPPKTKLIFTRCVIDGETYKQVSQELDITVNTIGTIIKRAYKTIRTQLGDAIFVILYIFTKFLDF